MRKLTTLTGKNLPKVAKPGWPERSLAEPEEVHMLGKYKVDYSEPTQAAVDAANASCADLFKTGEWIPVTPQALSDFTRVCAQTGLSERLRATWNTKKPRQPEG